MVSTRSQSMRSSTFKTSPTEETEKKVTRSETVRERADSNGVTRVRTKRMLTRSQKNKYKIILSGKSGIMTRSKTRFMNEFH